MQTKEWSIGKLLAMAGSYWQACTLHAAVKLEVFTLLGEETLTCDDLEKRIGAEPRGVGMLLNALTALGLLAKSGDNYTNTASSKSFLCKDSDHYLGYIIMHHHNLVESWARLDKSVLSGKPAKQEDEMPGADALEHFLMGMFNMASVLAPLIVEEVDLSGRRHLLDLGGGPGTYAIHFCLKNPDLEATVFDLHPTRSFAEQTIEKFGLSDRINFVDGDYLRDSFPEHYDVVWMSHILHQEGAKECQAIINKAVASLDSAGEVLVHEFFLEDTMDAPLFPALFSLNMLVNTKKGQSYPERQIRDMLVKAGLKNVTHFPFRGPHDSSILAGTL